MMLFLSVEGCVMQGSVSKAHVDRFKGRLVEGHTYYLHYLEVKQARDAFSAVDHAFEARVTKWTGIVEMTPPLETSPRYAYKLRSFQMLSCKCHLQDLSCRCGWHSDGHISCHNHRCERPV